MFSDDDEGKTWGVCSWGKSANEDREAREAEEPKAELCNLAVTTKEMSESNAIPKKSGGHVTCAALTVVLSLAHLT